jgi:MGT family glycosyltransferase
VSDVLFAAWDGGGAVPPTLDLARALVRRGHAVRVLADPTLRDEVEATGAGFRPWTRAPHRTAPGAENEVVRDWEARTPLGAFRRVRDRLVCGPAQQFAEDVLEEHRRQPADVVVAEAFLRGALMAAEAANVPRVAFLTTVNCVPTPGAPPFGAGFAPARGPLERVRDRVVAALSRRLWNTGLERLNVAREHFGLARVADVQADMASEDPLLVLSTRALEYATVRPPANVRYVGPRLSDPGWVERWTPPPGDEPLVLVGLSTTHMEQDALLSRCVAALGSLPVRGVVTTGPELDPERAGTASNVQVVRSAPHGQVLEHARAVVTHGGHGTVSKALASGVPLVVVPLGRDQNDVAARVAASGAGIRLKPSASEEAIAAAVQRVLSEPSYGQAARRIADAIATDLERDHAVEEIELRAGGQTSEGPSATVSAAARVS